MNIVHYKFLVVRRFVKCNFSKMDTTFFDIDDESDFKFEKVECPLRGECVYEGRVCMPKYSTTLTDRDKMVAKLWLNNMSKEDIARELFLSPETINNHIRRIYKKLGVHEKAEFVKIVKSKRILD